MGREIRILTVIRAIFGSHGADAAIAALADRQHGVVARDQLLAIGLKPGAIQRRIDAGRLHVIFTGVYAVGHRKVSREGRWMAGVLAGGQGAALGDASAAALHGFGPDDRREVHVVAAHGRDRDGIRFHRRALLASETTTKHGIPVTTPARTLLDLATTAKPQALERALREALFQHATSLPAIRRLLRAHRGDRGARALRTAIQRTEDAPGRVRSGPEERFLVYLRKHSFPLPELNVYMRIGDLEIEADCVWREHRLIAELDHRGTHADRRSFESDRRRDRRLQAVGWRAIRMTEPYDASLHADLTALFAAALRA
jgi:predicted transcriptional regulator of viral defense system